jgi:uncharacterized protein YndB with AHSA1/START domain
MSKRESDSLDQLIIERIFDAPREMVWKAWTDPTYVSHWWGPKDFTAPFCKIDFRVGGRFHYCMRSPKGEEYWNVGEYRRGHIPNENRFCDVFFGQGRKPTGPLALWIFQRFSG